MEKRNNWTILELIHWGQEYFSSKGIESPRLNIELIICKILNCQRIDLYLKFDMPLKENQLEQLRDFVKRRAKNEPLQYILGEAPFFGKMFIVDKSVLIPRPETELLVELAINYLSTKLNSEINVLEIGTGSGCISIILANKFPEIKITATDISTEALEIAVQNTKQYEIDNIEFIQHDFLNDLLNSEKFDLIISNPPYIPMDDYLKLEPHVLEYEPRIALTDNDEGLKFYQKFSELFEKNFNGKMLLEIDGRNTSELIKIFQSKNLLTNINQDMEGKDRIIEIYRKYNEFSCK
jgi:release factor glutamine methyltransferase